MSNNQPTAEEWRKLYHAAVRVRDLAPWEWMMEDEIFGVQNPETGEIGFVSVMGNLGEHLAIAVYPGATALYKFLHFEAQGDDFADPMGILEIPQLQASFEDRNMLDKDDRAIIKQLSLKFRGAQAWPQFRSFSPALMPWFVNAAEARFLTIALEQLPDVARRFDEDDELLWPTEEDEEVEKFLIRVSREENGKRIWEDKIMAIPEPAPATIRLEVDRQLLEQTRQLPQRDRDLEIELTMMPAPVAEKKERPFFPYMLMVVDATSSMLVGTELLQPLPTLEAMYAQIPNQLMQTLLHIGIIPYVIRVRSDLLVGLLGELSVEIGFQIKQADELPGIDQALDFLSQMPMFG